MEHVGWRRIGIGDEDDLDGILAVGDLLPGVRPNDLRLANRDYSVFRWRDYDIVQLAWVDEDLELVFDWVHEDECIVISEDDLDVVETDLVFQALQSDRVITRRWVSRKAQECKLFLKLNRCLPTILPVDLRNEVILVNHNLFVRCPGD